jgi:hypothetical protein
MDSLNDIQKIWLTTNMATLPKADEIIKTIKKYRLKHAVKNGVLIALSMLLIAAMCWVLFDYKSNLLVTRIGEACLFIAMFILFGIGTNSLKRIAAQKNRSNAEFISFLKQEQLRQIAFQKRTQVIGFAFASVGLLLYLFEAVYKDTLQMLVVYGLALIWIFVCWFIIRPRSIKRKTEKLARTIENLERLSIQLSNN